MMMTTESYWKLLRAGLWGDSKYIEGFTPLRAGEWNRLIAISKRTRTAGIIGDGIAMLPPECMPPQAAFDKLLVLKASLFRSHFRHNMVIRDLMALLDGFGVPAVLLKGQGLAMNFRKPESRSCGDIDVFIGKERIEELVLRLKEEGYTCDEEINDTEKHVVFTFKDIPVELHRDSLYLYFPRRNRRYQKWWNGNIFVDPQRLYIDAKGRWQKSEMAGAQCVCIPEPTMNVFFTFYHLFSHYMTAFIQLKQFPDLARLLYDEKDRIDLPLLREKLEAFGLMRPWRMVGCYLHLNLDLGVEYIPFYDSALENRMAGFSRRIVTKFFDRQKKTMFQRPDGRVASKIYSFWLSLGEASRTFRIFPALTVGRLVHNTVAGVRLLFSKANRTQGTREHYESRMASENHDSGPE